MCGNALGWQETHSVCQTRCGNVTDEEGTAHKETQSKAEAFAKHNLITTESPDMTEPNSLLGNVQGHRHWRKF